LQPKSKINVWNGRGTLLPKFRFVLNVKGKNTLAQKWIKQCWVFFYIHKIWYIFKCSTRTICWAHPLNLGELWREKITDQLYKRGQINLKLEQKDAWKRFYSLLLQFLLFLTSFRNTQKIVIIISYTAKLTDFFQVWKKLMNKGKKCSSIQRYGKLI